MYEDLKNKTALVTGAGRRKGIGFAVAQALAATGANVVITDLALPPAGGDAGPQPEVHSLAEELAAEYGVQTLGIEMDVTDGESIAAAVPKVKEKFGRLDVLCNNAGAAFGVPSPVQSYQEDAWMKTIDVNLHGPFRVSRAFIPIMMGAPSSIINVASRAGKVPPIMNGAYAVAKAGVIMLTKVMAKEMAPAGIRINAICPGQIMTDFQVHRFGLEAKFFNTTPEERIKEMCKTIPLGRIADPSEVGDLVAYLASKQSSYITGQAINITGGQLMEL